MVLALIALRLWQDRAQPRPWRTAGEIGKAATRLDIKIDSGQCNPPSNPVDRVEVEETAESVTVTAYVEPFGGLLPPSGDMEACLTFYTERVELERPLGDRTLLVGGYPGLRASPTG